MPHPRFPSLEAIGKSDKLVLLKSSNLSRLFFERAEGWTSAGLGLGDKMPKRRPGKKGDPRGDTLRAVPRAHPWGPALRIFL